MCGSTPQVLRGCPWLLPKALHVLAVPQVAQPHAAMFTLQTRVQQPHVESEMDKVCSLIRFRHNIARECCAVNIHIAPSGQSVQHATLLHDRCWVDGTQMAAASSLLIG
jgi:hypothetical protein